MPGSYTSYILNQLNAKKKKKQMACTVLLQRRREILHKGYNLKTNRNITHPCVLSLCQPLVLATSTVSSE